LCHLIARYRTGHSQPVTSASTSMDMVSSCRTRGRVRLRRGQRVSSRTVRTHRRYVAVQSGTNKPHPSFQKWRLESIVGWTSPTHPGSNGRTLASRIHGGRSCAPARGTTDRRSKSSPFDRSECTPPDTEQVSIAFRVDPRRRMSPQMLNTMAATPTAAHPQSVVAVRRRLERSIEG